MNEKLRQTYEEQLRYLPDINQQALKSFDWATELLAIGKGYGLHIDQLEDLQIETMLVLVGIVSPDRYENELIERLAVSPAEAAKIVEEVGNRVFTPIHDYILAGGVKKPVTPTNALESAGFQMTTDETPINLETPIVRQGGGLTMNQSIPDTRPTPVAPLSFQPNAAAAIPTQPVAPAPQPVSISREKLEKVYQERMQQVDTTLQSMDQVNQ